MSDGVKLSIATWPLLQRVQSRIPKGRLVRAVGTLAGGTAVAQILSVATAPILTRLYTPADYGVFAVLVSLVGIVAILGTCRYEMAITLPRAEEEADSILAACLILGFTSSVGVGFAAWLWGKGVFGALRVPGLYQYWWMIPACLLGTTVYQSLCIRTLRQKKYGDLAKTRLWQAGGSSAISISFGLFSGGPLGLILGSLASSSFGVTRLGRGVLSVAAKNGPTRLMKDVFEGTEDVWESCVSHHWSRPFEWH